MPNFFDQFGKPVWLGNRIGEGGEGAVFEVPSLGNDIVAKVYHQAVPLEKQKKLTSMAKGCDESLKKIAAWPVSTLHAASQGAIRGFLMPKVAGYEPVHHLYGPSHRKQLFPDKDWAFLINTARNAAAAFEVIHGHGHVIGDVNPNLVFVAGTSIVKLIDCDSFQIAAAGQHYLCEVGVPHFTPPELQGCKTFRGLRRTKNHDNFGLALLLFHLLLMGRHPFSGVFAGSGDMPLERAISQLRYAFGVNPAARSMSPPPNCVTTVILPPVVTHMFERAFSEHGTQTDGRPTAQQWVKVLDSLMGQVRACGNLPIHKYFNGLSTCPWCALEKQSGISFFISAVGASGAIGKFEIDVAWTRILAVASPGTAPTITPGPFQVTSKPIPESVKSAQTAALITKAAALAVIVICLAVAPGLFFFALIVAGFLFFSATGDAGEKQTRQAVLSSARSNMGAMLERWKREAGDEIFQLRLRELATLRTNHQNLGKHYSGDLQRLEQGRQASQLKKFLERFFIENADIPCVGRARKAILASFGIETAADIDWHKVIAVNGFGERITRELVDWRKGLERRFVFDPSKGVDPADIATLNQRYALKHKHLEGELLAGPEQLMQIRQKILQHRSQLLPTLQNAALQVAQAEADLAALG